MLVHSADSYCKLHGRHIKRPSRVTAHLNNFCLHIMSSLTLMIDEQLKIE